MRTATITLNGEDHLLCFSARVVRNCTERYGGMEKLDEVLSAGDVRSFDEALWLLAEMMTAGDRYARQNGTANPSPLSVDDLLDLCDISDFAHMRAKIRETIVSGRATNVEVEPQKNAVATQGP